MQLARLIKPHTRWLGGKTADAVDALQLEARLSKNATLELWINAIPFGSDFGNDIERLGAFSRVRFSVTATELDDARAATFAVVPRRPGLYDPVYNAEISLVAAQQLAVRCNVDDAAAVAEAAAPVDASGDGRQNSFLRAALYGKDAIPAFKLYGVFGWRLWRSNSASCQNNA